MTDDIAASISKSRDHSIGDLLRRSAQREPNKTALICGSRQLDLRRVRCDLQSAGRAVCSVSAIEKGDRVAVLARNSHAFAALRFALARIGAVLVPINFMLKPDEVAYILRQFRREAAGDRTGLRRGWRAPRRRKDCAVETLLWLPGEDRATPPAGIADLRRSAATPRRLRPRLRRRQPRPGADRLHQRHRIAAQGRDADARSGDLAVRELHHRRRHGADDMVLHALPLYHCAQLDVFLGPASTSAPPASSPPSRRPTTCCR